MRLWIWTSCYLAVGLPLCASDVPADKADPPRRGIVDLSPQLHLNLDKKELVLDAEVVLTEGALELFLCPRRTKEHESILAADVDPKGFFIALNQIAEPGTPAQFEPKFKPPTGQKIKIDVEWEYEGIRKRSDAREWIRQPTEDPTKVKAMAADFVFAGSRFVRVPGQNRVQWLGDEGYLVCVSNFPGAIIDVSMQSDNSNAALLFEAWTDRIPPKGTKVRVHFLPVLEPKK